MSKQENRERFAILFRDSSKPPVRFAKSRLPAAIKLGAYGQLRSAVRSLKRA